MEPSGVGSEWKKIHLAASHSHPYPSLSFSSLLSFSFSPSHLLSSSKITHISIFISPSHLLSPSHFVASHIFSPNSLLGRSYKMRQSIASRHHLLHFLNKISNFKSDFFVPSFQMHLALSAAGRVGLICINNYRQVAGPLVPLVGAVFRRALRGRSGNDSLSGSHLTKGSQVSRALPS